MSVLEKIKAAKTRHDVATILGFKAQTLSYLLYIKPTAERYVSFEIPKKSGGVRTISAPIAELKFLQRQLADLLVACSREIEEKQGIADTLSHGFRSECSILTNAYCHRNRRFVFNADLEDFFGSINFGRVRGYFITNKDFALHPDVATVLAQIACHENKLPQGSPCSPIISNLIGHLLDVRLASLAKRLGCIYTRYVDDLTFSTNKKLFPSGLAYRAGDAHRWEAGDSLIKIVSKTGFKLNPKKTRVQYRGSRQVVTGLTVNEQVGTRLEYRRTLRAMVYRVTQTGAFELNRAGTMSPGRLNQLDGMLRFVDLTDQFTKEKRLQGAPLKKHSLDSLTAREKTYQEFLLYKEFYASTKPVIIFEGETDSIYIRSAIRSLADEYPSLVTKEANGKRSLKLRFFKRTGSAKRKLDILGIPGGSEQFRHFLPLYFKVGKSIKAPCRQHPVILLLDNDDGAKSIYSILRGSPYKIILDKKTNPPFVKVDENLYVIFTPLTSSGEDTCIEDFFPREVLETELEGKKFNPANSGLDPATEYGKGHFARYVVTPKANEIDFRGFRPILDRIKMVVDEHAKKIAI